MKAALNHYLYNEEETFKCTLEGTPLHNWVIGHFDKICNNFRSFVISVARFYNNLLKTVSYI